MSPKITFTSTSNGRLFVSAIPQGVCSMQIDVALRDGIIEDVAFIGGCSGNSQGLASLLKGMKVTDAIQRLEGIDCGGKHTSCPDQLAQLLKQITNQ